MRIEDIERLAGIMRATGLTSLEWSEGDRAIRLAMGGAAKETAIPSVGRMEAAVELTPVLPEEETGSTVKAPMVGMLYLSPAPDAAPYVAVGDKVKKGDVLCIIEAMKLMNEITAEQDGEIAAICAQSGQIVEFGQPLFRLL